MMSVCPWSKSVALGIAVTSFFYAGVAFAQTDSTTTEVSIPTVEEAMEDHGFVPMVGEFAAAIVLDPKTKKVLYEFEADVPRVAASLTKLVHALAFVSRSPTWLRVVSIAARDEVGGGRLRVKVGTRCTIRDLFYASVTASANNAATALARVSGLSMTDFIKRMNEEAKKTGAVHSIFFDASGMDPRNLTTARDMAYIARAAFRHPRIRAAATTASYPLRIVGTREVRTMKSTHQLLTHDDSVWVTGGKTGYLEESGYNLVTQMRPVGADGKPDPTKEVLIVILGSPTKEGSFASTKRLASWVWER